ncbi:hypothetical protein [Mycolicibacterium houstonense]|uniref:hypothetical protein n=1 Tax=Mycolicibacterium houstonense TaxID=146021 RepID=UPI000A048423|nr:hypothetical protein [Mycolicibacterium houstonense]
MSNDEPEIIDAEIVESDNLPALVDDQWNAEALEGDSVTRSNGVTYTAKPGRSADGVSLNPETVARHDAALAANPERRCVATTSKGQCRKFAILGSTVCKTHGGAAKQVAEKARVRVQNASNRLMGKLIEFAFDDTKPPDTQLRAIRDSLDRAGLRPPAEVVLSQGEQKPYEELFEGISTVSRTESRRARDVSDPESYPPASKLTEERSSSSGYALNVSRPEADEQQPDTPPAMAAQSYAQSAPPRRTGPRQFDRERDAQPPVTGADALRIAGQLARQKAIESPHKRYPRP